MVRKTSDPPLSRRLVTCLLKDNVIVVCGTIAPVGTGVPPEQFSTRSPESSVSPSDRTVGGTPLFAIQTTPIMAKFAVWLAPMFVKVRLGGLKLYPARVGVT